MCGRSHFGWSASYWDGANYASDKTQALTATDTITSITIKVWGSETPSSSISDLGAAIVPIVLAARTSPKSWSNACSNPGDIHRHVATPGGLKPRTR